MSRGERLNQFLYIRDCLQKVPKSSNQLEVWSLWDIISESVSEFKEIVRKYVNDGGCLDGKIHIPEINKYLYYKISENAKPEMILKMK